MSRITTKHYHIRTNGLLDLWLRFGSRSGLHRRACAQNPAKDLPEYCKAIGCPDAKVLQIAKLHRVSEHTVRAIRERESVAIAERKQRLMSVFANVAELSAERMEELAGQANLRDAGITAGIATDKLLALVWRPCIVLPTNPHPPPVLRRRRYL